MARLRAPVFGLIAAIIVGGLFVLIGVARPDFLWTMGKIARGRAMIGDGAVSGLFIGLGIALIASASVALARNRAAPPK